MVIFFAEIESADQPSDLQANDHSEVENDEELPPKVRSKTSRKKAHNKNKADKSKREAQYDELRDEDEQTTIESADDDDELPATSKRRKPLGGNEKRPKHKKSKKSIG